MVENWQSLHFLLCNGYYRPQRSCGKVLFLHLSVILVTGGVCLSACWDTHTPLGRHPKAGTPYWADIPPADGYCSGRYASYWNAFLLYNCNFPFPVTNLTATMEFSLNGNTMNSGNLINHWIMNWAQFKDSISDMCLSGAMVASWSLT